MQKIRVKLKNTLQDTSLVLNSVSSVLNKEEIPSVQNKVRTRIIPEENHSQRTGRSIKPLVFVLSKEDYPLMPCTQAKAVRMLKKKVCYIVNRKLYMEDHLK
jgi:hypothetical protein